MFESRPISIQLRSFVYAALAIEAALACVSAHAYVEPPPFRFREGYFRLSGMASYYQTNSNYTETRNEEQNLASGNALQEATARLKARYNLTDRWSAYLGGEFVDVRSHNSAILNPDKDNPAVTYGFGGIDVALFTGSWRLVAELEGGYDFDVATYSRTSALGSDGANYGKLTAYLMKPLGGWMNALASAGAKYRDQGLATQFLWSAALEKPFLRRFLVGAGVDGYESIIGDALRLNDRKQMLDRVNGGSYRHDAFNDALIEAAAWVGWAPISSLQIKIGYQQSLTGQRSAAGQEGFLTASWNFDPRPDADGFSSGSYGQRREREDARGRDATRTFRVQDEKTDDSLFYEDAPPKSAPKQDGSNPLDETEKKLERKKR